MTPDQHEVLDLMQEVYKRALIEQDPDAVRKLSEAVDRFHDKREFHRLRERFLADQITAFAEKESAA